MTFFVYVNVIQNDHLEHEPECVSSANAASKRLSTIANDSKQYFRPDCKDMTFNVYSNTKVGGVVVSFSRRIQVLFKHN